MTDEEHDCPSCDRSFSTESGMKTHHARSHGESLAVNEYECANCGETVEKADWQIERAARVFCDVECAGEYRSERVTIECDACGTDVEKIPSEVGERNFCSYECMYDHGWELGINKNVFECEWCGKEFETWRDDALCCSRECWAKRRSERWRESPKTHPAYNSIDTNCEYCDTELEIPQSRVEAYDTHFCDNDCRNAHFKESDHMSGEDNPAWAGGYEPYYGPNWTRQRDRVRERDDYECQACGVTENDLGKELDVHHITPFREFVEEGEADYEAANRLENLVSLCRDCHREYEGEPAESIASA